MVRLNHVLIAGALVCTTFAYGEIPSRKISAATVAISVQVTVQHVFGTGDTVIVSAPMETFGEGLMTSAAKSIGAALGGGYDRFSYVPNDGAGQEKVFFIVNGLISPEEGSIVLQPIVRAFMFDKQGKILRGIQIEVAGIRPNAYSTLASFTTDAVDLRATFDSANDTIQYRIAIRADKAGDVTIPPKYEPATTVVNNEASKPGRTWLLVLLVVAAGASAGALVYFALLNKRF